MKRIFVIALAVVAVNAAPAAADHRPDHNPGGGQSGVTIRESAKIVTFGGSVTFTGAVRNAPAGTAVEVWQNPYPYTGGFTNTGRAGVVDPQGNYTVTGVKPQVHTRYKVVARTTPPVESSEVFIQVRLRISLRVSDSTPRRGSRVRFYGTVSPRHAGKVVAIQRRDRTGKFVTVARTRTTSTSTYSRRVRVRSTGVYRAVVTAADPDHLDGTSRTRTLRTHR